jgi:hypothetical protein
LKNSSKNSGNLRDAYGNAKDAAPSSHAMNDARVITPLVSVTRRMRPLPTCVAPAIRLSVRSAVFSPCLHPDASTRVRIQAFSLAMRHITHAQ